jgi:hypothetical protein
VGADRSLDSVCEELASARSAKPVG